MVAEDNNKVKKKRDGKGVNCIDEEELHDRSHRTGCFGAGGKLHEVLNRRTYMPSFCMRRSIATGCRMYFLFARSCQSRTPAKIEQKNFTKQSAAVSFNLGVGV
jgi:hypothetical protein